MILKLQKRHRQIWTTFAVILPVLFVWSYTMMANDVKSSSDISLKEYSTLPNQLQENPTIQGAFDSSMLVLAVQKDLRQSSCLVFISKNEQLENLKPVGQLFQKGIYEFELQQAIEPNDKIILYNPISKTIIQTIENKNH